MSDLLAGAGRTAQVRCHESATHHEDPSLLHIVPAGAVETLQLHIGDHAIVGRAGVDAVVVGKEMPLRRPAIPAVAADQFAPGLVGFLGFRGLALSGFREAAGLMFRGLPAAIGVTAGSGSGLKNTRHSGES
jgi:hypothetical protein